MKKNIPFIVFPFLSICGIYGEETAQLQSTPPSIEATSELEQPDTEAEKIAVLSEAFGHLIAKHIESLGVGFDLAKVIKGLEDAGKGIASSMSESECMSAISKAHESAFAVLAQKNLEKATLFMEENAKNPDIIVKENGKLQIKIQETGTGPSVESGSSPLIRYTGKFIDGTIFGSSKEDDLIVLDETIPGFGSGLIGMQQGEKRTLFIHPDLAYGTTGQLPPNSLLIFDVELVALQSSVPTNTPTNTADAKEDILKHIE